MPSKLYDTLIVGGGPAGLSAATSLARQATTALILDSGAYRNARSAHMHNVPGWDHQDPAAWREKARSDLRARYAEFVTYRPARVVSVRKSTAARARADETKKGGEADEEKNEIAEETEKGKEEEQEVFLVSDEAGRVYRGKKLILATGSTDVFTNQAPGFDTCWARGIFHCLFCHGYEERGAPSAGLLATDTLRRPEMIAHILPMARRLARSVTIYTDGDEALARTCPTLYRKAANVRVDDRKIASYSLVGDGPQVRISFATGEDAIEGFCVASPKLVQTAGDLTKQLGLQMTDDGVNIKVQGPWGQTSVKGCWAAGDCSTMMKAALNAMMQGGLASAGALAELGSEQDG